MTGYIGVVVAIGLLIWGGIIGVKYEFYTAGPLMFITGLFLFFASLDKIDCDEREKKFNKEIEDILK